MGTAYAKGCKRDALERRTQKDASQHPRLKFFLASAIPASASLQAFEPKRLDQGRSGSCTAGSSTAATACAFAAAGSPLGWIPSQLVTYATTRTMERVAAGDLSGELTDDGAMPADVVAAMSQWGVRPMGGPTPDGRNYDIWTDADAPNGNVNLPPQLADLEQAGQKLLAGEWRIDEKSSNVSDQVASAIAAGYPVLIGAFVDAAFENWKTGDPPIGSPNLSDPNGGGHAIWLSAYTTGPDGRRVFRLVNSWSESYGDDGTCLVNEDWLCAVWDIYVWAVARKS